MVIPVVWAFFAEPDNIPLPPLPFTLTAIMHKNSRTPASLESVRKPHRDFNMGRRRTFAFVVLSLHAQVVV